MLLYGNGNNDTGLRIRVLQQCEQPSVCEYQHALTDEQSLLTID